MFTSPASLRAAVSRGAARARARGAQRRGKRLQVQALIQARHVLERVEVVLVALHVVLHQVLHVTQVVRVDGLVVQQAQDGLQLGHMLAVPPHRLLQVHQPRGLLLPLLRHHLPLHLRLERVHLRVQVVHHTVQPLARLVARPLTRVRLRLLPQPLLGEGFRLCLPLADLEALHLALNHLARVYQLLLVLDLAARRPRLDLVAVPLQLLDLLLQVRLELLLLVGVLRVVHLVPDAVKDLYPLLHLLQRAVNLRLQLAAVTLHSRREARGGARG